MGFYHGAVVFLKQRKGFSCHVLILSPLRRSIVIMLNVTEAGLSRHAVIDVDTTAESKNAVSSICCGSCLPSHVSADHELTRHWRLLLLSQTPQEWVNRSGLLLKEINEPGPLNSICTVSAGLRQQVDEFGYHLLVIRRYDGGPDIVNLM